MALRELKVCLLGVSAVWPVLRGAAGGRLLRGRRGRLAVVVEAPEGSQYGAPLAGQRVRAAPEATGRPEGPSPARSRRLPGVNTAPLFSVFFFKKRKERKREHPVYASLLLASRFGLRAHKINK